jgi:hypothetical protein
MFFRVVAPRIQWHSPFAGNPINLENSDSSRGRIVAVKYTNCASVFTKSRNPNIRVLHPSVASNTVWHSSTTIRSNLPIACCRLMKLPKLSLTADSGVTKTIDAHSLGLRLSHSTHSIPARLQRSFKLPCNETNGTTTTVTPVEHDAGNMNNMLLPAPVPITTTTGLFCCMIASITSS